MNMCGQIQKQSVGINVKLASIDDSERWDKYVLEEPQSTFFHRFGWKKVIENTYGHQGYYFFAEDQTRNIKGVLPLFLVKSPFFGTSLISTAFTVGGGALSSISGVQNLLVEYAVALAEEKNVQYLELRGGDLQQGLSFKENTYAGFVKPIEADEQDNLKSIPRKKRADIRKGIKAAGAGELFFETDVSVDVFYALYAESVRNLGTPVIPKKLIKNLYATFATDMEISCVMSQEEPVAALVSFYHKNCVLPYYGGAKPVARPLRAYDFMYWSQMRRAAEKRCTEFDFGRSKIGTGAYEYKTHWGFTPESLRYQYHLVKAEHVPDVNPNNPKFHLITNIWQKLPLPVANFVGPKLAGNLA